MALKWYCSRNTNADAGGEMHAKDHVMVIGAGAAGQALIKEIIKFKKTEYTGSLHYR